MTTKRCAIYCRVSTSTKDQTTENQLLELKSYCERMGYEIVKIYEEMMRAATLDEQKKLMREYERRIINGGHAGLTLWWNKINPHRSYVKGWKIAPSHYLNQHLDQVWLDKS